MKRLACVFCVLLLPGSLSAWEARVIGITDGDSITVAYQDREFRIELADVDCPEMDQPWGEMARQFTSYLVADKPVMILPRYQDAAGALFAFVFTEGINLNKALLRAGLAWHCRIYSRNALLTALEMEARAAKKGLWGDPHPIPPWEFRHHRIDE